MSDGFFFAFGGLLVFISFCGGMWLGMLDRQRYGGDRFDAGVATGIARERHENWRKSQEHAP